MMSKKDTINNLLKVIDAKKTDMNDIMPLIGLLILAGIFENVYINSKVFLGKSEPLMFSVTIIIQRFKFLLRHLRFEDIKARPEKIINHN